METVIWLIVAVAAAIGEAFSLALVLGSFAAAAVVALLVSLIAPASVQIVAFGILSVLFLLAVRPAVLRFLPSRGGSAQPQIAPTTGVGMVTERIDAYHGQIRVGQGEFFSARASDPGESIEPGREVEIVAMQGLSALVRPVQARTLPAGVDTVRLGGEFALSPREIEVLQLLALGLSNAEIAQRLVVSERTVHHHVSHILTKMNADNRTEAVSLGLGHGLIQPGEHRSP